MPKREKKPLSEAEPLKNDDQELGQSLAQTAFGGLAKILNRSIKRAAKAKQKLTGHEQEDDESRNQSSAEDAGLQAEQPSSSRPRKRPASAKTSESKKSKTSEGKKAGSKKSSPITPSVTEEPPQVDLPSSQEDDDWEPDWQSTAEVDDELPEDLEDEGTEIVVDLTNAADEELNHDLIKAPSRKRASGKGKPRAKKAAKEESTAVNAGEAYEHPYTDDDEIWKVYEEKAGLQEAYVPKVLPELEPPKELLMSLLPYQKEFLGWAVGQEKGDIKGGILADEMGMGKTIQAISLIVTHRTDDNSKLARLGTDIQKSSAAERPKEKRPRLKLLNAPVPKQDVPSVQPVTAEAEPKPEPVPSTSEGVKEPALEKADNEARAEPMDVDSSERSPQNNSAIASPGAQAQPGAVPGTETKFRPSPSKVMAIGDSCCGKDGISATGVTGNFCRATLVICPVVAVIQWRQEIARYTEPGALKVVVYHGNKRAATSEELEQADVVLTTYSIIENEFRRHTQPKKATCTYCQKKFLPDRLKVHLRFFCGPNAKKSAALAKQQKKRPRTDGAQATRLADEEDDEDDLEGDESENDSASEDDDDDEDLKSKAKGKKRKRASAKGKTSQLRAKKSAKAKKPDDEEKEIKKPGKASAGKAGKSTGGGKTKAKKAKPKGKKKARSESDDDSEFSMDDEDVSDRGGEDSDEAGPSRPFRPSRVINDAGWAERAMAEAEEMIAASVAQNEKAADVGPSVLHQVHWRRIILDEAHSIKDRRSSTARAVFALNSKYKWALSGTPLQNRVSELYSLVRFLRLYPYAYYFCSTGRTKSKAKKKPKAQAPCFCSSLDYSFKTNWRKCDHCGHSPLRHYCYWNKWVANPIKKFGYVGRGQSAMLLLKTEILEKILLRRTKVQCADVLALPPRTITLRKDKFDEREEDFYEALYTQSQAQFDSYVKTSTVLNNYAHVFSLLVRLRQAVNHPYLVVHSAAGPGAEKAAEPQEAAAQAVGNCNICQDNLEDGVTAACGHAFCRACIREYLEMATSTPMCTGCRKPLTIDLASAPEAKAAQVTGKKKQSIISRISLANFQSSTKIEALREELDRMICRDPSGKAIVFSQFTSMLDLIAFRLGQVGIKCVRLEGSMEMKHRDKMIEMFTTDASVKVFLMSLKAGGVALNLTAASHVMLMDPWWNPAVEQQAQDRIHRLGQYKPIHVTRFVIGGTIEERILKLQEKKQLVFEGTVGRDAEALGRLTEDDLRFLFG